jgi:signal transduction histidine kinase
MDHSLRWSVIPRLLGVSLVTKVVGANVLALAVFLGVTHALGWRPANGMETIIIVLAGVWSLLVTTALLVLALRPLWLLEDTVHRVWLGDYHARVAPSRLADKSMRRVTSTLNTLLDRLTSDRTRARALAAQVIRARDEERSRTADQLHESTAHSIAAISWQLGVIAGEVKDATTGNRLQFLKQHVEEILEDVRDLAENMRPKVLEDLGLAAALQQLARHAQAETSVLVVAEVDGMLSKHLGRREAATLYAVAQEAISNALLHAHCTTVTVKLRAGLSGVVLEIHDDGSGFDVAEAERTHHGRGIFTMRERLALVNAQLTVESSFTSGTRVSAYIPMASTKPERAA